MTETEVFELAQKHGDKFRAGHYKCIGEALRNAIREAVGLPTVNHMSQCDRCGRHSNTLMDEPISSAKRRKLCPFCVIEETETLPDRVEIGSGFDMGTNKR